VKVSTSPEFLESVANHPRVLPNIGGDGKPFKAGDSWADSVGLEWDEGGIVFVRQAPGIYSAHFVFLPKTPDILGKCREALRYMFTRTACHTVTGKTPIHLKHARRAAKAAGMVHLFDCDGYAHTRLTAREWIKHKELGDGMG